MKFLLKHWLVFFSLTLLSSPALAGSMSSGGSKFSTIRISGKAADYLYSFGNHFTFTKCFRAHLRSGGAQIQCEIITSRVRLRKSRIKKGWFRINGYGANELYKKFAQSKQNRSKVWCFQEAFKQRVSGKIIKLPTCEISGNILQATGVTIE